MIASDFAKQATWHPWTSDVPPDHQALLNLDVTAPNLVALLGSHAHGERGRFGIVGIPSAITTHESSDSTTICRIIDERPTNALRILLLSYESGRAHVFLPPQAPPRAQPACVTLDLQSFLLVDHQTQTYALVHLGDTVPAWTDACLQTPSPRNTSSYGRLVPLVSDDEHERRVRQIQDAIARGDIYQANLTRRLAVEGHIHSATLASDLALHNPVPHAAFVRLETGLEIISNSMETLLTFDPQTQILQSHPIKGTHGRHEVSQVDTSSVDALRTNAKEQAEHIMIVDLVRNDLGKVAEFGKVSVPDLMRVEAYHGVLHGVSTVQANLHPELTLGHAVSSLFPAGSITGTPKRRAMEFIEAIESEPRGMYTGSLGVIAPDGTLSLSVLIRTMVKDSEGWNLAVGGGIVADSSPSAEVRETWSKVSVFQHLLLGN